MLNGRIGIARFGASFKLVFLYNLVHLLNFAIAKGNTTASKNTVNKLMDRLAIARSVAAKSLRLIIIPITNAIGITGSTIERYQSRLAGGNKGSPESSDRYSK